MDEGDEPPWTGTARPKTDDEPQGTPGPEDSFRTLAEDWIAIWQSEITAYLTDPETQQAWGAMMAIWAGAAQAMMRSMPQAPGFAQGFAPAGSGPRPATRAKPASAGHERRRPPASPEPSRADAAPGPTPAAPSPVARDDAIRRLEQRVAELERSLAEQDRRRGTPSENRRARRPVRPRS
jgi:hypothetical protein